MIAICMKFPSDSLLISKKYILYIVYVKIFCFNIIFIEKILYFKNKTLQNNWCLNYFKIKIIVTCHNEFGKL